MAILPLRIKAVAIFPALIALASMASGVTSATRANAATSELPDCKEELTPNRHLDDGQIPAGAAVRVPNVAPDFAGRLA
jgi:hypothetical protein